MCKFMIDGELEQVYKLNQQSKVYEFLCKLVSFKYPRILKSVGYFPSHSAGE